MKTADAVRHFKSKAELARRLKIKKPSVSNWGDLVPPFRAQQIHKMTRGRIPELRFRLSDYEGYYNKPRSDSFGVSADS